jgi:AraC-like DNA-binding protein
MNNTDFIYNKMAIFAIFYGFLGQTMDPLLVRTFGYNSGNPWHSSPGTKEQDIMLGVFIEGLIHFQCKRFTCEIPPGSIAFFLPDDPGIIYSDQSKISSHYYCRFNGSSAFELINRIIQLWGGQIFKSENFADIVLILKKMKPEFRNDLSNEMRTQEGYLFQILFLLLEKTTHLEKNERYMKMIQYLENRSHQILNLQEMSNTFHLSTRQLNRLFKNNSGMSIGQYHEKTKINLSKSLLENSHFPINDIAQRVGYQDALYFSRVFKKNTGLSPMAWRNKIVGSKKS